MVYTFTCPHCERKEYSAKNFGDQKYWRCVYCLGQYENPYYEGAVTGEDVQRPAEVRN